MELVLNQLHLWEYYLCVNQEKTISQFPTYFSCTGHGKFPSIKGKNSFFIRFTLPSFPSCHPFWYHFFFHFLPQFLSLNYMSFSVLTTKLSLIDWFFTASLPFVQLNVYTTETRKNVLLYNFLYHRKHVCIREGSTQSPHN